MFHVLMNGVGNAFSRIHWGTSFLCKKDSYLLAIDCPDSYRRALLQNGFLDDEGAPLDVDSIDAMILTHLHGDHVNGLEMVACFRRFSSDSLLSLHTSPEVLEDLWERRLAPSLGTLWDGEDFHEQTAEDFLELHELPWEEELEIGPFQVTSRRTRHHIPTMALRISDGESTLGYSCDTAFDPELIEWLSSADLIIHETGLGSGHTQLEKLVGLEPEIRQKMLLSHYPDFLTNVEFDMDILLASEGQHYPVGG